MRPLFDVPALVGSVVRLEPLSMDHAADLARAAEEDRSSYAFTLVPHAGLSWMHVAIGWFVAGGGRSCLVARLRLG